MLAQSKTVVLEYSASKMDQKKKKKKPDILLGSVDRQLMKPKLGKS